jgi:hypothetical protein
MIRFATMLVVLTGSFCQLLAQESPVLIGTTNREKHDQHLYAVARSIVDEVAKSQANVVSRIFILQVTKSDCCDPISIGGHCFQCCDNPNHVICTNYGTVGYIMGRIKAVSKNDWEQAQRTEFKEVKEWASIAQQLEKQPVQEVSPESPDAKKFWEGTQL